jgi:glycerophosphoryl diester phosphodiesterase
MDALSSFPGQPDTPHPPESGIIHLVKRLHDSGKPAWATADTLYGDISPDHPREDLTELVRLGVDGIITNLPELLQDVLEAERHP